MTDHWKFILLPYALRHDLDMNSPAVVHKYRFFLLHDHSLLRYILDLLHDLERGVPDCNLTAWKYAAYFGLRKLVKRIPVLTSADRAALQCMADAFSLINVDELFNS